MTVDPMTEPKRSRLGLGVWIVLIFVLFLTVRSWMQRDMAAGPAPELVGFTLAGPYFSLDELRGRPAMIHFWASWCAICRAEERSIAAIAADHPVITVATQSGDGASVAEYLDERDLRIPVVVDESGEIARRYGIRGVPATFVLGRDGHIRFRETGYSSEWGLRARLWLAGLFRSKSPAGEGASAAPSPAPS
jgi:thiol-disulfide isomerase/thioredoxin